MHDVAFQFYKSTKAGKSFPVFLKMPKAKEFTKGGTLKVFKLKSTNEIFSEKKKK